LLTIGVVDKLGTVTYIVDMDASTTKPAIINSTSFWLSGQIRINKDENHGKLDIPSLVERIHTEGKNALFVPSSFFKDGKELMMHYAESYFRELYNLPMRDVIKVGDAYMEEVNAAKENGRYFGRNPIEVEEIYPDRKKALDAIKTFLESHGYHLREGVEGTEKEEGLLDFYRLEDYVEHQTEQRERTREDSVPRY
jgi:hypothetical protein